jgi:hypothetical protein
MRLFCVRAGPPPGLTTLAAKKTIRKMVRAALVHVSLCVPSSSKLSSSIDVLLRLRRRCPSEGITTLMAEGGPKSVALTRVQRGKPRSTSANIRGVNRFPAFHLVDDVHVLDTTNKKTM